MNPIWNTRRLRTALTYGLGIAAIAVWVLALSRK